MRKKMTPCEKLGYKVGDEFTVIEDSFKFGVGSIISLQEDDGTGSPYFTNEGVKDEYPYGVACFLSSIKKFAKLKPAKQALADAIHQNGGWLIAGDYSFVTSNHRGVVKFFHQMPRRDGDNWVGVSCSLAWVDLHQQLPNWHQTILSRDEYFTAYPEQKVEAEMKSESEMTIKVGDWHKNGELPPVGEVCEAEYNTTPNIWSSVRIIGFDDGECIFRWISGGREGEIGYYHDAKDFRPLRTERDKAIDEMQRIIEESNKHGVREQLGVLYDAGIYKEVK